MPSAATDQKLVWEKRTDVLPVYTTLSHPSTTRIWWFVTTCNRFAILCESEKEIHGRSRWYTPFEVTSIKADVLICDQIGITEHHLPDAKAVCQRHLEGANNA